MTMTNKKRITVRLSDEEIKEAYAYAAKIAAHRQAKMPPPQKDELKQWLQIRREEALRIDPNNVEVCWWYAQTLDPYGVDPDLPEEYQQIGREYFACRPGSDVWVSFDDLPDTTRGALWASLQAGFFMEIEGELKVRIPPKDSRKGNLGALFFAAIPRGQKGEDTR